MMEPVLSEYFSFTALGFDCTFLDPLLSWSQNDIKSTLQSLYYLPTVWSQTVAQRLLSETIHFTVNNKEKLPQGKSFKYNSGTINKLALLYESKPCFFIGEFCFKE